MPEVLIADEVAAFARFLDERPLDPNMAVFRQAVPRPAPVGQKVYMPPGERNMNSVASYFGLPVFNTDKALFGVEVEVEGQNLPEVVNGFQAHPDGSLRGENLEYVFNDPSDFKKSVLRLKRLCSTLEKEPVKLDMSFRTSVHVHVNVSHFDHKKLCTFLYLAFLLEEPLVRFCGEGRIGNRFCLRVKDAGAKVEELSALFARNDRFVVQEQGHVKYSAINLATLKKYGTVEFRSMRGTTDIRVLSLWLSLLECVYNKAHKFNAPKDVAVFYELEGSVALAREVFGDLYHTVEYTQLEEDIARSYSLLIQLPYEFPK